MLGECWGYLEASNLASARGHLPWWCGLLYFWASGRVDDSPVLLINGHHVFELKIKVQINTNWNVKMTKCPSVLRANRLSHKIFYIIIIIWYWGLNSSPSYWSTAPAPLKVYNLLRQGLATLLKYSHWAQLYNLPASVFWSAGITEVSHHAPD